MRMLFIVTLFAALAVLAAPLRATVVVPADLGELARDARAIVRGRVLSVDGRWTEDRRTIETIVTLEAASYLKGALGSTLQFRVPGGDLGRYRSIVVGAPRFAANEEVVVFLGAIGPSVPYIVGFNQGVYRIARAADNSGPLVTPPALLPSGAGSTPVVRGDPSRRPLPLADFEAQVRVLAGGSK
jgi:hypothetical protein